MWQPIVIACKGLVVGAGLRQLALLLGTILLTLYVSQVIDSQALCQSRGLECFISLPLGYAVAMQSV